jgi:6-bladed beta-propeller
MGILSLGLRGQSFRLWRNGALVLLATSAVGAGGCREPELALPEWSLQNELKVGNEGSPEYALTDVGAIAVTADGSMYVLQRQDATIRVFDREGHFIRYVGRRGEGPGEFDALRTMGIRGDTLWAADRTTLTRFTLQGEVIDKARVTYTVDRPDLSPGNVDYVLADGAYAAIPNWAPYLNATDWPPELPLWRIDGEGGKKRLGGFSLEPFRVVSGPRGTPPFTTALLRRPLLYGYSPDGAALAIAQQHTPSDGAADQFQLALVNAAGDTIYKRAVPYTPIEVPQVVRDSLRYGIEHLGSVTRSSEQVGALLKAAPIPEYYPPIRSITVAADRSVWVGMQGYGKGEWSVWGPTGIQVARVSGPSALQVLRVSEDELWGVEHDEQDIPRVVRYRILKR